MKAQPVEILQTGEKRADSAESGVVTAFSIIAKTAVVRNCQNQPSYPLIVETRIHGPFVLNPKNGSWHPVERSTLVHRGSYVEGDCHLNGECH